jgi:phosphocarrier protein
MAERELTILNKLGLHARPAAEFVRCVRSFKSTIIIRKGDEQFSASSILDVLTANLECGAVMILIAEGPDSETALDRLSHLLDEFKLQEG